MQWGGEVILKKKKLYVKLKDIENGGLLNLKMVGANRSKNNLLLVKKYNASLFLSLVEPPIKGVYNICSGEQYKLKDIIQTISNILEVPYKVTFSDSNSKELTSTLICGDNSKILTHSKFPSLIPLYLGLKNTINYYKNIWIIK